MKKNFCLLGAALTALVLELLPFGAVCNFANPEGEPWRRTYSYFDPTPYGYANFAPFLVALLTVALLVLTILSLTTQKPLQAPIRGVSIAAALLSFAPLLLGVDYYSVTGGFISLALAVSACVAMIPKRA